MAGSPAVRRAALGALIAMSSSVPSHAASPPVAELMVDASRLSEGVLRVRENLTLSNADAGVVTLAYPKWLPGQYKPAGPINDVMALQVRCAGNRQPLAWQRHGNDMFLFDVILQTACVALDIEFEVRAPMSESAFFGLGGSATPNTGQLNWHEAILYPAGTRAEDVRVKGAFRLPAGWTYVTSIPTTRSGDEVRLAVLTLDALIDSPVIAGRRILQFDVSPPRSATRHTLSLLSADSSEAAASINIEKFRRLVAEAEAIFGPVGTPLYNHVALEQPGSVIAGNEYRQLSNNRIPTGIVSSDEHFHRVAVLMGHEFVHNWNGTRRYAAGSKPDNYSVPVDGGLLWVTEGLTEYYGEVIATRAGAQTHQQFLDRMAVTAAMMQATTGRHWRSLQDTATAVQLIFGAPPAWTMERRSDDFYIGGAQVWLEIDATIRRASGGRRSLDDFARHFFSDAETRARGTEYRLSDVIAALNEVLPYDWKNFLDRRIYRIDPTSPTNGLMAAGWHLVYDARTNPAVADVTFPTVVDDQRYTIGVVVDMAGTVMDVVVGSEAELAGLMPGWRITSIDGRPFEAGALGDAVAASSAARPLEICLKFKAAARTVRIAYSNGPRHPHLVRDDGTPDLLADIMRARASSR